VAGGGCALFLRGSWVPISHSRRGRLVPPYQLVPWSIQPFGHNRKGTKIWGLCHLFGMVSWSPSNTKSPGTRPTCIPSCILSYPAVWPQQTWAENWGLCPFDRRTLDSDITQCGRVRGLLRARFHFDPSRRLVTIHQRYRQDRQNR